MEIFNFNKISEKNQKMFLNLIHNFFLIKQKYIKEYCLRNKDNMVTSSEGDDSKFSYERKVSRGSLNRNTQKKNSFKQEEKIELGNFGYSSFGSFFFNSFFMLKGNIGQDDFDENDLPAHIIRESSEDKYSGPQELKVSSPSSKKEDFVLLCQSTNMIVENLFHTFRKKIVVSANKKIALDTEYKYLFNIRLANWKIMTLPLQNSKKLTCRICNEKFFIPEFIMHTYNCQEKSMFVNELKKNCQEVIDLSKKLSNTTK